MTNVDWTDTTALTPNRRNARTHSKKQIGQIADSIKAFGFLAPILVDERGNIIAGHGRYAAALQLGLQKVPDKGAGPGRQQNRRKCWLES